MKAATSLNNAVADLSKFWSIEGLGVEKTDDIDSRIDKSITFADVKYSISLPKKEDALFLTENYANVKNRFISLEKVFCPKSGTSN